MLVAWLSFVLLATDPRAARADVSGGVAAELRGGAAPVDVFSDPVPSMLMIVTPNIDLMARGRRGGTFVLGYSPRMQLRLPNRLSINRPLFLHQFYANYAVPIDRRWSFFVDGSGSVGELDYTTIGIALGPGQAVPPGADVTQYLVAEASLGFAGAVSDRHVLGIVPSYYYRTPIGDTEPDVDEEVTGQAVLPTQTVVSLALSDTYSASRRDDVTTRLVPQYVVNSDRVSWVTGEGRVFWNRRVTRRIDTALDLGVFAVHTLQVVDASPANQRARTRAFPVGGVQILGRLAAARTHWLDGSIRAGVDPFIDRVRDAIEPRANAQIELTTTIPPRWTAAITLSGFTPITRDPQLLSDGEPVPETLLRAQTPITYMINDNTRFEFGTVLGTRLPHLAADRIVARQLEAWLYIAFRIGGSTARGNDEFGTRSTEQVGTGTRGIGLGSGGR